MKIRSLSVYTSNLEEQLDFYRDELGFEVSGLSEDSFELKMGYSVLKFKYRENATPYHIALHVPDNQEKEALEWLESIVPVLDYNTDKIIDFSNWEAKSVYFYDRDHNIMEFISRREFHAPESAIFNADNIVGVAEIGLVTNDITSKFEKLNLECNLNRFDGDFERFCAIGEASGLLITIDGDKKDWFPTGDKAHGSDFELEFEHSKNKYQLEFSKDKLNISKV
ncbi:hypothetical protein GCM10023115_39700 [Pontixanthobacter gangjinensis]|uniref:VOC family protein n=1 Tax=Christiangramia aestuarii TaxID=1028746 RepID=A0A7K1LS78_9FLAO|nr:VOC family protein [Christiangramia aestuarii]MUP43643.1 VOC family protein [Christiangramia aestuarii]